ncbi:MAG: hypothetical protein IPP76_11565 [Moraxellaceae bacterium]|nr:hypothetical protein [Moraxellaceae bacterium]
MSRFLVYSCLLIGCSPALALELKHEARVELRSYFEQGAQGQSQYTGSLAIQSEANHQINEQQQAQVKVFARWDEQDSHRSSVDVQEALWTYAKQQWQLRAGIGQVFWGVTEGQHLVDVVNQRNYLESIDGDIKLGQPLINVSFEQEQHLLDVYLLPYFREQPFASYDGRLRLPWVVEDDARYESGAKNHRIDAALRYQFNAQGLRLGLSAFSGTSREPLLQPNVDPTKLSYTGFIPTGFVADYQPTLAAYYPVIEQLGLDVQYIVGDWLLKLETIQRHGMGNAYTTSDVGFEYTQVGAFGSMLDVGWLAEYLHDSRNNNATHSFEHDVLLGWRLAFNDTRSSELLTGVVTDTQSHEQAYKIKGSTRLYDNAKLSLEGRFFNTKQATPSAFEVLSLSVSNQKLAVLSDDSFIKTELTIYF